LPPPRHTSRRHAAADALLAMLMLLMRDIPRRSAAFDADAA